MLTVVLKKSLTNRLLQCVNSDFKTDRFCECATRWMSGSHCCPAAWRSLVWVVTFIWATLDFFFFFRLSKCWVTALLGWSSSCCLNTSRTKLQSESVFSPYFLNGTTFTHNRVPSRQTGNTIWRKLDCQWTMGGTATGAWVCEILIGHFALCHVEIKVCVSEISLVPFVKNKFGCKTWSAQKMDRRRNSCGGEILPQRSI